MYLSVKLYAQKRYFISCTSGFCGTKLLCSKVYVEIHHKIHAFYQIRAHNLFLNNISGADIMYECCNVKRFLRLLLLDAIIFGLCLIFFFIGRLIVFSLFPELADNKEVQTVTSSEELSEHENDSLYLKLYTL